VAACESILARGPEARRRVAEDGAAVVARTSWDATASAMAALLRQVDEASRPIDDASDLAVARSLQEIASRPAVTAL
jgi:hypothetical protein